MFDTICKVLDLVFIDQYSNLFKSIVFTSVSFRETSATVSPHPQQLDPCIGTSVIDFQKVRIQGLKIRTYELLDPISTLEGRTARVHRSISVRGSERGERETDRDGAQYE